MVKRRSIPPPTQAKGDATIRRTVPRPTIQVPTLPKQSQTTLQSEVSAAQARTVKGVENVPVNPPPTPHYSTNKGLQAELAAAKPAANNPLQNAAQPTRPDAPPPPQNAAAGHARGMALSKNPERPPPPSPSPPRSPTPPTPPPPSASPERNAKLAAAVQQANLTTEKAARDRSPQNGQNQAKEKTPDKNRDRGHER